MDADGIVPPRLSLFGLLYDVRSSALRRLCGALPAKAGTTNDGRYRDLPDIRSSVWKIELIDLCIPPQNSPKTATASDEYGSRQTISIDSRRFGGDAVAVGL
jgi:hypothetical protein